MTAVKTTTETVMLADLIEDHAIYPRHAVDSAHVGELARALQAGETLPVPIVDRKSKRIVDGFHRVAAHRRVYGPGATIEVEFRSYASEVDLVEDAVRLNARHGRKFDSQDRVRSTLMLERLGRDTEQIAAVLSTTPARVEQLRARVVIVDGRKEPAKPIALPTVKGELDSITSKPRRLTDKQLAVMRSSTGWRFAQTARQMVRELRSGLVEPTPDHLALLRDLRDAIDTVLDG